MNYYAAIGKIKRLLLVDPAAGRSRPGNNSVPRSGQGPLSDFRKLIIDMNVYNDIEIILLTHQQLPVADGCMTAILRPRMLFLGQCNLPPRWIQDCIDVYPGGISVKNNTIFIQDILCTIAEVGKSNITSVDGGNLLFGRTGQTEYVLTRTLNDQDKDDITNNWLQMDPAHLFELYNPGMDRFNNLFYHIDLFVAIVGKTPGTDEELVLVSEAWTGRDMDSINSILNTVADGIIGLALKDGTKPFRVIRLPEFILLSADNRPENDFVLSYTNCIIENYIEEGRHVINVYLPDYLDNVMEYIHAFGGDGANETQREVMEDIIYPRLYYLMNRLNISGPLERSDIGRLKSQVYEIVLRTQQYIINLLNSQGIYNITFVRHMFTEKAGNGLGTLRCLSKVLEREMPG